MDATRLLERLCARHGLALDEARCLLPLVERALVSPLDVRDRILHLIETNLARRAGGEGEATLGQLERDLDEEVLRAVALTLHGWEPSKRVREFGDGVGHDGAAHDGAARDGAARDGAARDGAADDGTADDGDLDLPGGLGI